MRFFEAKSLLSGLYSRGFLTMVATFVAAGLSTIAHGQNTSYVSNPDVVSNRSAMNYRISYDANRERISHRAHVQHAFSGSFRLRGVVQQVIDSDDNWSFSSVQLQSHWQRLQRLT